MSDNGKVLRFNDVPLNHFDVQNRASWKLHERCEQYCVKQLILSKFKVIFLPYSSFCSTICQYSTLTVKQCTSKSG